MIAYVNDAEHMLECLLKFAAGYVGKIGKVGKAVHHTSR